MPPVVILPTYNEAENIGEMLTALIASPTLPDVLVVDDSSPDGTAQLVRSIANAHPGRVHLLLRESKSGLGAAYRAGFGWAFDRNYDVIIQMDADGSHPVDRLPALVDAVVDGADLAVGSRYAPAGAVANWPTHRRLLSRFGNWYARTLLEVDQRDLTGAYRVWRSAALRAAQPDDLTTTGYGFLIELALSAHRRGLRVVEIPITFTDRVYGESKMNGRIAFEAMCMVLRLRWRMSRAPILKRGRDLPASAVPASLEQRVAADVSAA